MAKNKYYSPAAYFLAALSIISHPSVLAHLMPAYHGTLNVVDNGAFMVLSVPISTFKGLDEDGDSEVSLIEFNRGRSGIVQQIQQQIALSDSGGKTELRGLLLSPASHHGASDEHVDELTILGRFALNNPSSALHFRVDLFSDSQYKALEITANRQKDLQKMVFKLTPEHSDKIIFSEQS